MIVPPGGIGALLVLCRKGDRAHLTLQLDQRIDGLVRGVEQLTLLSGIGATAAKVIGLRSCRDRWKIQDLEAALLLQVADQDRSDAPFA